MSNEIKAKILSQQTTELGVFVIGQINQAPFTDKERDIMELIIKAHNLFVEEERAHPSEIQEWITGIHQLQSILQHRLLCRIFPEEFTSLKNSRV